jgi:hypothetical protein
MNLNDLLAWDDAGPVAILMFCVVCLTLLVRWLLRMLIADKDKQIGRLETMNDKVTDQTAVTLQKILDALREKGTTT